MEIEYDPDKEAANLAKHRISLKRAADLTTLHVEPDGCFSVAAFVARPGQDTRIHDHVTWCVAGVVQGAELEERFVVEGDGVRAVGSQRNEVGAVTAFAPPGDLHRVTSVGDVPAISIHVYGVDLTRVGTSVRRYWS